MAHDTSADKVPSLDGCCQQLKDFIFDSARLGLSFHDFEQALWAKVLRLGHLATQEFLDQQGSGDLGPELTLPDGQQLRRLEHTHPRDFTGVFGTFTLPRTCYGAREGQKIDFVPLDNRLQLPPGKFSYLLQDFNGLLLTDQPFAQVAAALERILDLKQHVDSLERQSQHMAEHAEPYRDARPAPPAPEEGPILVRSADAKGVPMRRPADAPSIKSHDHKRGPKTGRKKQAIVGAVYSVAPLPRTAEDIVEMLFCEPEARTSRPKRPTPCHKRVMARLNEYTDEQGVEHDGMAEVFTWMAGQLEERNPRHDKVVVNLFDGDKRLPRAKAQHVAGGRQVDILDLLHVTPKLWAAAAQLAPRESPQAEQQVRAWVLQVLKGKTKAVLQDMRQQGEKHGLKGTRKKELAKACNFLDKRRGQMRYHRYLKAGYPIASGVIEGACRHYVKDRMERTGMSWKQPGAQAMLELRSVALNGDWDEFQSFYRQRQCAALYPHRQLLEEVSWPLAA
jgi:hypothetical protein